MRSNDEAFRTSLEMTFHHILAAIFTCGVSDPLLSTEFYSRRNDDAMVETSLHLEELFRLAGETQDLKPEELKPSSAEISSEPLFNE